jgi:SnoaL-like domain
MPAPSARSYNVHMDILSPQPTTLLDPHDGAAWPVAGLFRESFAHRDFPGLAACLHPDLRFRALVPPGPFETLGVEEAMSRFRRWFDGEDDFEVLDASIGQVGARIYLRWRVRMRAAADPESVRLVEQHAFASAGERIESLDLLCSGFQLESGAPRCSVPGAS